MWSGVWEEAMFNIESTLKEFTQALLLGKPVVVTAKGEWS